jgi:hypothetical protein
MSAKSANIALDNITRNLKRHNLPRLAPAPGFDGDEEYREQVEIWKKWIAWEKEDPLVLASDEPKVFKQRILGKDYFVMDQWQLEELAKARRRIAELEAELAAMKRSQERASINAPHRSRSSNRPGSSRRRRNCRA